jgi:hypothetical protein
MSLWKKHFCHMDIEQISASHKLATLGESIIKECIYTFGPDL